MRLDMFIQEDMKQFLDEMFNKRKASMEAKQIEGVELLTLSRDYEGDLKNALQENNLSKARDLFHDVLELYKHARTNEEKDLYYRILFNMYKELKNYLKRESETKTVVELVEELEDMGVFSNLEKRYPGTKKSITESLSTVLSQPQAIEYKPIDIRLKRDIKKEQLQTLKHELPIITETVNILKHPELVKKIKKSVEATPTLLIKNKEIFEREISLARQALSKKNLEDVIYHYRKAAQAFKQLDDKSKEELFKEGISVYRDFNNLVKSLRVSQEKTITTTSKEVVPKKSEDMTIRKIATQAITLSNSQYFKALQLMKKGEIVKAKELFESLIQKNPHHIAARIRLMEIKELLKKKNFK